MRFVFIILLSPLFSSSQNLLMNGNFEEENICTEYIKNCAPEGWISTSLKSDYYFDDVKNSFEGQHFVGLIFSSRRPDFVRSHLLCQLRPGSKYKLDFAIRSTHGLDSIGVYFSSDDILYRKKDIRSDMAQVWISPGVTSGSVGEWQNFSAVYTATGTENFISIGSYKKTENSFLGRPDLGDDYYFFIDMISLTPLDPHEKLCDDAAKIREEEYAINERHGLLEKKVYVYSKNPPPVLIASQTVIQRVDTLVIPDILFAVNSFELQKKATELLDSMVVSNKNRHIDSLVVEGHTDSTGSAKLNEKLSQNRAAAVTSYLQKNFQTAIVTRGWASQKPVADNRTSAGRQKNRRVEMYLYVRE
jgi:outer membrane protein OmpA-like peptidoglycan-associated protein